MSKTFLYSIGAIALYLFVIKPINNDELGVKEEESIISDFDPNGINGNNNDWTLASSTSQTVKNPTYTV